MHMALAQLLMSKHIKQRQKRYQSFVMLWYKQAHMLETQLTLPDYLRTWVWNENNAAEAKIIKNW